MSKKKQETGIPLDSLLLHEGFERHLEIERCHVGSNPTARTEVFDAIEAMIMENARAKVLDRYKHKKRSTKGGCASAENQRKEKKDRNDNIKNKAKALIDTGTHKREIAGKLAPQFGLSARQIRSILKS